MAGPRLRGKLRTLTAVFLGYDLLFQSRPSVIFSTKLGTPDEIYKTDQLNRVGRGWCVPFCNAQVNLIESGFSGMPIQLGWVRGTTWVLRSLPVRRG
jgi:hypothetical protein